MERKPGKSRLGKRILSQPNAAPRGAAYFELLRRLLDNSDVWERIFVFLEPKDRIRTEMVNQRFRSLMLNLWKTEKSFDAASIDKGINTNPKDRIKGVIAICHRIGVSLRLLNVTDELSTMNLRSISEACPNIESIVFLVNTRDTNGCSTVPSAVRFDSFAILKNLLVVPNGDFAALTPAPVFLSIPPSIESISGLSGTPQFRGGLFETAAQLEAFFADRPSLREVRLCELRTRDGSTANIFRVMAERCPLLKRITLEESNVDFCELVALESMIEIEVSGSFAFIPFSDAEVVEICERNPLVEVLSLRGWACNTLGFVALEGIASLTKLRELTIGYLVVRPTRAEVAKFVRELARNSGGSLRKLDLTRRLPFAMAAVEALAAGCLRLRSLKFAVEDVTAVSIRHMIDCVVADPSWNPADEELTVYVNVFGADENDAFASFAALTAPAANLPDGVRLTIVRGND